MSCQSRFDARDWMLGAGALGQPRGMEWGGRMGSPIFPSGCEGKLGVLLESLQGQRDLIEACVQDLMFLSRGDRDHGDAFQTHPVSQASARGEAKALARDGVSREVPCSALKGETVPDSLPATPKSPPTRRVPPRGCHPAYLTYM